MIWQDLLISRRLTDERIAESLAIALGKRLGSVVVSRAIEEISDQEVFCLRSDVGDGSFGTVLSIYAKAPPEQPERVIQKFAEQLGESVLVSNDEAVDPYAMRLFEPRTDPRSIRLVEMDFDEGRYKISQEAISQTYNGPPVTVTQRVIAPGLCPVTGYWITPAWPGGRRRFESGELMPEFRSDYGATIWQWDDRQGDWPN
ncbi:hypothetical protein [Pseudorhodoferax sp.]|uniref:hypothetical protein n=1 Tax=Pseudorhodoferax sp. TaxID=1993553 RepID=UPI0039E511AD